MKYAIHKQTPPFRTMDKMGSIHQMSRGYAQFAPDVILVIVDARR
jgi:hypothetical protein